MNWFWLLAGLVILTLGADVLVRAASALALAMRVSPLVVGLTIVAFGTSAPELVVSAQAALTGQADIALGNVVGSNIFNVLFILGASALITPLVVAQQLVRFDVPVMIALSLGVWWLGSDGAIGRGDGVLLLAGLLAYTAWCIRSGAQEPPAVEQEYQEAIGALGPDTGARSRVWRDLVLTAVGLGLLVLGSRLFVEAAIEIARTLGVSELLIGLTLVAAGTSLPEVATSLVAAIKGERDIAVGNVVGSNIFNILGVLGLAGTIGPQGVGVAAAALEFDIPVMTAVAMACLPVCFTGHRINRWEGGVFLGYYVAYVAYLASAAETSGWGLSLRIGMLAFVVPLTVLTLVIGVLRQLRRGHNEVRSDGDERAAAS